MYRLMLVEDEEIVRNGMLQYVDFKALGFEVVAVCENGRQAYERFEIVSPDIVLTDICMAEMSGFEFIEKVYTEQLSTKFVIISGYDDFDYMKKALKYHVMDYILKPITPRKLKETLIHIKGELDKTRVKMIEDANIKFEANRAELLEREAFLNKIVNVRLQYSEVTEQAKNFGLDLSLGDGTAFQAAVFDVADRAAIMREFDFDRDDLLPFIMQNIIEEISAGFMQNIVFKDNLERIIVLIREKKQLISAFTKQLAKSAQDAIQKYIGFHAICRSGGMVENPSDIMDSFRQANDLFQVITQDAYLSYDHYLKRTQEKSFQVSAYFDGLLQAINAQNYETVSQVIDGMFEDAASCYLKRNDLIVSIKNIVSFVNQQLQDVNLRLKDDYSESRGGGGGLLRIKSEFKEDILNLFTTAESARSGGSQKNLQMKRALEYINDNFNNYDLSFSDVSKEINMSASYFTLLFKQTVGTTFTKYLNSVRLANAQKLLKFSDKNINQIAETVGYINVNYFVSIFKKTYGVTPNTFRKNYRENQSVNSAKGEDALGNS